MLSMPRSLSGELWLIVFRHMCLMPLAHRKSVEEEVADFQPTLAACALVCRLFNDLASQFLYTYPIVYSLPLFIIGIDDPPAVTGSNSKAQLLARTQRLFFEDRSEPDERYSVSDEEVVAYTASLKTPGENFEDRKRELMRMREGEDILKAWRVILAGSRTPASLFPRLRTVSAGAVSGSQGKWAGQSESEQWDALFDNNREALYRFLTEAPAVRHFCRAGLGMYNVEGRLPTEPSGHNLSLTTHSDIYYPELKPIPIGFRTNWIVHTDGHHRCECNTHPLFAEVKYDIRTLILKRRDWAAAAQEDGETRDDWSINVRLFVGIADAEEEGPERERQREEERRYAERDTQQISQMISAVNSEVGPTQPKVSDFFETRPLFDASCAACGWCGENAMQPPGWGKEMDIYDESTRRMRPYPMAKLSLRKKPPA